MSRFYGSVRIYIFGGS